MADCKTISKDKGNVSLICSKMGSNPSGPIIFLVTKKTLSVFDTSQSGHLDADYHRFFAESIKMNTRHLSAIKSSELRNRYFNELGATKLACLWVLEHCAQSK